MQLLLSRRDHEVCEERGSEMITVNIRYTGVNSSAQAFAKEMIDSGTVAAIRAEDGNIRYEILCSAG